MAATAFEIFFLELKQQTIKKYEEEGNSLDVKTICGQKYVNADMLNWLLKDRAKFVLSLQRILAEKEWEKLVKKVVKNEGKETT